MEDQDSPKKGLRHRGKKQPSDGDLKNGDMIKRLEKIDEKPVSEEKNKKGDDVALESRTRSFDWETIFQINVQLDGIVVILFVLSFLTRTFRLSQPKHIVFDELHYGKYVKMYNEKTFFFDQHPPLGKQLIAAVTNLVGFGNYTFSKIGAPYNDVSAR